MFDELPIAITQTAQTIHQMPEMPIAAVEAPSPPPSPDQVKAAEAVFAARERESETVAGLLSMWTGITLLHDLALEAFSKPAIDPEDGKTSLEERRRAQQP